MSNIAKNLDEEVISNQEKEITIEVIRGVEGNCLSINNYRFVGSKPWGGGTVIKQWKTSRKDFIHSLNQIGFNIESNND